MQRDYLYINGEKYDSIKIVEELIASMPTWKVPGLEFLIQMLDPSEAAVRFNTSGTTGNPKEIRFSKNQIWTSAENTCRLFNISENDELLLCLPADFVAGRMMLARALYASAKLNWVEPSLNPLKEISNIHFAAFTPAQVATILAEPTSRKSFEKIGKIIIGGGELSIGLEKELMSLKNEIYVTYGMTETLSHVAVRRIGETIFKSIYTEAAFTINSEHCLVIELPFLSKSPLVTNDIVELIDGSSFIWRGRLDNVINSGGKKIFAEALERKILDAGLLREGTFYISRQKEAIFGEVPVIVMLNGVNELDVATLLPRINELLNKHEFVKQIVFFDKFERTETGKLKRLTF